MPPPSPTRASLVSRSYSLYTARDVELQRGSTRYTNVRFRQGPMGSNGSRVASPSNGLTSEAKQHMFNAEARTISMKVIVDRRTPDQISSYPVTGTAPIGSIGDVPIERSTILLQTQEQRR